MKLGHNTPAKLDLISRLEPTFLDSAPIHYRAIGTGATLTIPIDQFDPAIRLQIQYSL